MKITTLFNPNNAIPIPATFAFYVANNGLDNQALQAFKATTQAKLLIALVTDATSVTNLAMADTVIYCKAEEVENLIQTFETFFISETLVSIDEDEAIEIFNTQKNVHFYRTTSHTVEQAIQQALANIKSDMPLAKLCVLVQGEKIGFEAFSQVSETVENTIVSKNASIFYAVDMSGQGVTISLFEVNAI